MLGNGLKMCINRFESRADGDEMVGAQSPQQRLFSECIMYLIWVHLPHPIASLPFHRKKD